MVLFCYLVVGDLLQGKRADFVVQMVTIEINLKEGDKEPEQHLDEGEHIQRVIVPLTELYDKLQGTSSPSLLPWPP